MAKLVGLFALFCCVLMVAAATPLVAPLRSQQATCDFKSGSNVLTGNLVKPNDPGSGGGGTGVHSVNPIEE
jgi:hypothetical protein